MKNEKLTVGNFTANLRLRIPEAEEIITGLEGELYANRRDNRTLHYSMVAYDILEIKDPWQGEWLDADFKVNPTDRFKEKLKELLQN